jgi:hypothetical protein
MLLTLLLAGCPTGPEPGVRLLRPAPDGIVAPEFDVELEVTGQAESAGIDLFQGEGVTDVAQQFPCPGSCTVHLKATQTNTYGFRGWAVIEGKRYETPRHQVTVDRTPLTAVSARIRAFNTLEVRFNKPLSPPSPPEDVRVLRSVPVNFSGEVTDSPRVEALLESDGQVLVVQGDFGAPARLLLSLNVTDSHGAWRLAKDFELDQPYFTEGVRVAPDNNEILALMFDPQGRAIVAWGMGGSRSLSRLEAGGAWTDLLAGDALEPCLRDGFSTGAFTQASDGQIYAVCGSSAQVARLEGNGWVALGPPLSRNAALVSLVVDGQGRPVVLINHQTTTSGGNLLDHRVSVQRYESGAWRVLTDRLNAADKRVVTTTSLVVAPDGVPLAMWTEGNIAQGSQHRSARIAETGPEPLAWAADLALSPVTASDGAGGLWMAAKQLPDETQLVLRIQSSTAPPQVVARGVELPQSPVFHRDDHGHLALFGFHWEQENSIFRGKITLQHLEGGVWKKLPELTGEVLEHGSAGYRHLHKAARAPDGGLHAVLTRQWRDSVNGQPVSRQELLLVRRAY